MDTRARSLTKALLWQALGLLTMGIVGLALTGSLETGGKLALANAAVGAVMYLAYERVWQRIGWGRLPR